LRAVGTTGARRALFPSEDLFLEPAIASGQRSRNALDRDDVHPDAQDHRVISTRFCGRPAPSPGIEHQFLTISPLVSTPERPIPSPDGLKMKKLKKSLPLPSGPSSHAITVNGTRSGPSRPMASNSTPWLGTLHAFELLRYSLIKVVGSLDTSAKTVAMLPSG